MLLLISPIVPNMIMDVVNVSKGRCSLFLPFMIVYSPALRFVIPPAELKDPFSRLNILKIRSDPYIISLPEIDLPK